ncbi:MAG TPA: single-stranded-DNA-specific exonuclease RecJ [Dokdonella sp.]
MTPLRIVRRARDGVAPAWAAVHPVLGRVYAARGVLHAAEVEHRLASLAPPAELPGVDAACALLAEAIARDRRIVVVGDFDCDGATATAVAVRGLRLLGARDAGYRVPNRVRDGYGLSVSLVDALAGDAPDLILTVDNGISSHAGVAAARARGIRVVVTDHHLPGPTLPHADAIVNPKLAPDADARLGNLAGVGVVFYLLLALRARLHPGDRAERDAREAAALGRVSHKNDRPDLAALLDLVALGTVADLVPLDANNRCLVEAGLKRIRSGRASAGVAALFRAGARDPAHAVASDLGYVLGPRVNAAGRLDDMRLGIECLLTDDPARADSLARQLSEINAQRRELQTAMVEQGEAMVAAFLARRGGDALPHGVVLCEEGWHPGVVGLVASKLKERLNRPVVACAPAEPGSDELRGSARSIAGFHLRDALAEVDACRPGLIARFGGHAMAAGLTLSRAALPAFAAEFDVVARRRIEPGSLQRVAWSDGELAAADFSLELARLLRYAAPWGQAFPEPLFDNVFDVEAWRPLGERHLRLGLRVDGAAATLEAVAFNVATAPPPRARVLYRLDVDHWNGRERLQLVVHHLEPA